MIRLLLLAGGVVEMFAGNMLAFWGCMILANQFHILEQIHRSREDDD